jgi:hypothetical protein
MPNRRHRSLRSGVAIIAGGRAQRASEDDERPGGRRSRRPHCGLLAGQIVLAGSLAKTVWVGAGDKVVMELAGLGKVAVTLT